ncbi:hypothetical protein PR001_g31766, partial [Phytophthora rubi]
MAPTPSNQTAGASPAYQLQGFDDLADKVESGYAGMPVTPKATTSLY